MTTNEQLQRTASGAAPARGRRPRSRQQQIAVIDHLSEAAHHLEVAAADESWAQAALDELDVLIAQHIATLNTGRTSGGTTDDQ